MSLQFPQDTSTQLTYSSFPFYTPYDTVNTWSKSTSNTNFIYNTSPNGKVGINTTAPQGALEIIGYNNSYRVKFGTAANDGTPFGANRLYSNGVFRILTTYYTDEIATFHRIDSYDSPSAATEYFSIRTTGVNITGDIYASGNAGIGVSPGTYKLNVNGSINSTSFYQNGTLIDFSSYATNTNLTNNYYNKTNIDSLLNAKQQAITTYTISTGSSGGNIAFSTSTSTFTLTMPNNYTQNMSISNLITPTSFIYKGTELSTSLSTYATTTQLNNNISNVYTNNIIVYLEERQYPPKLYNSVTAETTTTFLGKSVYTQTITLNTTDISYGSGDYIIYSSSTYGSLLKNLLYDLSLTNEAGSAFQGGLYNSPSGIYNGSNFIVSGYTGDWIILKLPVSIILTKFSFKERSSLTQRAPAEWKCYGSIDGITFTEIIEASQSTRLTASDYPLYTKTLNTSFNTPYLYIGWTFNKIVGGLVNSDMVNFNEIQIYGKEQATPFYISSNVFNSTLTNYSTTAINDNNYLKKTGGNMTGDINMNSTSVINFGQRGDDNLIKLWTNGADTYGFGINAYTLRYNTPNGASHKFYSGTTNVATINSTGTITATSLAGIGSNLTLLDYNNIALNKPTNFQTDWNTTIINKPTNFQTDWNTTIINKPTYFPIDPATYYNKSEINGLSTLTNFYNKSDSDSRFLQLSGGTMTGALTVPNITLGNGGKINTYDDYHYIQISQLTDTITIQEWGTISFNIGQTKAQKAYINSSGLTATAFFGNGANITNLAYSNITGTPSIYTQSQSDARYLQLSGGTMTGSINMTNASTYLNFGTRAEDFLIKLYASDYGFGINAATLRYNAASGASHKFYSGSANTVIIDSLGNMLVGNANTYPNIQLGSTNGYNLGVATLAGHFSTSASAGDMILRSINKLILQSGGGGYSLMINADNSISCSGALTLSGALNLTGVASGNNPLYISSTNTTANNCIQIKNNSTYYAYIGLGGTAFGGNYTNNLFIESASSSIILNTNGRNSGTVPNFIVHSSGNIGIGITTPDSKLHIETTNNITTNLLNFKNTSGYGIYATSTSISNRGNTLDFLARDYNITGGANITNRNLLSLSPDGNVGIGITNPFASLCIGTPLIDGSDGALVISKRSSAGAYRNFKLAFDGNYNFCIGDFGGAVSENTWSSNQLSINWQNGNIGIGTTGQAEKLYVKGTSYFNDTLTVGSAVVPNQKYAYFGGLRIAGWDGNTLYNETRAIGITALNDIAFNTGTSLADYTTKLTIKPSGNIGIGTNSPNTLLEIYNATNPKIYLNIAGTTRCFLSAQSGGLDLGNDVGTGKYIRFMPDNIEKMRIDSDGNVNIGTTGQSYKLYVNGTSYVNGNTTIKGIANIHNGNPYSVLSNHMSPGSLTIGDTLLNYGGGNNWNTNTAGLMFECSSNTEIAVHDAANRIASLMYFEGGGINKITIGRNMGWDAISSVDIKSALNITGELKNQYWKFTNQNDFCRLYNNAGTAYFNFAAAQLYADTTLQVNSTANINGVLTMGSGINFKNDAWNYSTDNIYRTYYATNGTSYYQGNASVDLDFIHLFRDSSANNKFGIYKGVNYGIYVWGQVNCSMYTSTTQNPHDYVGVPYETAASTLSNYTLYLILNSFTGFHRNFTNDELFDENDPQLFKDTFEGRIVISTGKIATQIGNQKDGYDIKYDKEAIGIEDTHPIVELSRNKKDKRVFGVLGMKNRKNSNEKRLIVNSVGEGGIWVCNSNAIIENGDYITSSNYLGYGEKQDEIFLCNYTVAKATMGCNFELDSPYYNCYEIDDLDANGNKLRVAFIGCTYHSG